MNFSRNYKGQIILAALGFLLLLAARANSQEIVNTDFPTPSTSVSSNFNTPAPAPEYSAAAVAPQSVYTPASALSIRVNNEMQQLNAPSLPREAGMFAAIAILLLACVVMKKVSASRRYDTRSAWNSSPIRAQMLPIRKAQTIHS